MTERVHGPTRFAVLSGYPDRGAAIGMTALGLLAILLSLLVGNWWLVLAGLGTVAVGVRWWWQIRTLPPASAERSAADDSPSEVPDGHR